jgi:Cu-Zn family superoxide dismutase
MTQDHGKWNEAPFHLGDLGNVEADEYGSGSLTVTTSLWTIGTHMDDDIVGKAIIVHAGEDDFVSQPTGAAGGRIACGVIESN